MAEARRRVCAEQFGFELEHEVRFLGPLAAAAAVGERPPQRTGARGTAPESDRADRGSARPAARPVDQPLRQVPAVAALARGRLRAVRAGRRHVRPRAQTSMFALRDVKVAGGSPLLQQQVQEALAPELGRSLVAISAADVERRLAAVPRCARGADGSRLPAHAEAASSRPSAPSCCCGAARPAGSSPPAAACCARSGTRTSARCPASGCGEGRGRQAERGARARERAHGGARARAARRRRTSRPASGPCGRPTRS